jgi:serine O-acetyltransferase
LGPITIGRGARVGANAVILKDVPEGATMVGVAARPAARTAPGLKKSGGFAAYGTPSPNVSDPMSRSVEGLLDELGRLRTRIEQLESDSSDEQNQSVSGEEAADGKNDVIPPNC